MQRSPTQPLLAPPPHHAERLRALGATLQSLGAVWRESPFTTPTPAWCAQYPALTQACLALDEEQRATLEGDPAALHAFVARHLPELEALPALLQVDASPVPPRQHTPRQASGVPGRKWAQIQAFAAQVSTQPGPLLDWCSGKAHLGRMVAAQQQRPLHAVERNPALCTAGLALAARDGVALQYQCADVLRDPLKMPAQAQILALHACGDLHRTLVDGPALETAQSLLLAPCCYHLWLQEQLTPLSSVARAADLQLNRNQVQLAVQETVHAPARELRKQATLAAWRLGFDGLQREWRGVDAYLPTPSLPHRELEHGFEHVCRLLAAHAQLELPATTPWSQWEAWGWQRWQRARLLQLARQSLRRALEMWLVLDLALRLEERGFRVQLRAFCPRMISPRNLLLAADRVA